MENFKATEYNLQCISTGRELQDSGWVLDDDQCASPSLVRASYAKKQLDLKGDHYGLYRFCDWLPVKRVLKGSNPPITYKSEKLAKTLGLNNLYITFNGYFPEKGALMSSCSFKETEAYSVCGRMNAGEQRVLVVASAGNTARAFAKVCSENNIPLLLCVPQDNINALWFEKPLNSCVKLVTAESGGDYFDAIHLSNLALGSSKFMAEGGAKNIARRDGMATTVLSAVTTINEIPDYYFQAVGSGTGAIAAWEANLRFNEDDRYKAKKMKLMLSQNYPFQPMYEAWRADSRDLLPYDADQARKDAEEINAKVLSNRKPPYGIAGGLYDALKDSDGDMFSVTNTEATEAAKLFLELEGIDIYSASAVAVASLIAAVKDGLIDTDKIVMLNITGGGEKRYQDGKELFYLQPSVIFPLDVTADDVVSKIEQLFA